MRLSSFSIFKKQTLTKLVFILVSGVQIFSVNSFAQASNADISDEQFLTEGKIAAAEQEAINELLTKYQKELSKMYLDQETALKNDDSNDGEGVKGSILGQLIFLSEEKYNEISQSKDYGVVKSGYDYFQEQKTRFYQVIEFLFNQDQL